MTNRHARGRWRAWTPARGGRASPYEVVPVHGHRRDGRQALALALAAISPAIGGVLVRGEKGTAKSTMVRALTALLPTVTVVANCRFSCDPDSPDPSCPDAPHDGSGQAQTRPARLVELPVGATEDRVLGALHLERALREGVTAYEPGLLARAHRGPRDAAEG